MLALRYDGALHLDPSVPLPAGDREVLVRVRLAGVCSTDLEIVRGYKDFHGILGHEFVGEIGQRDAPFREGTRVCGEINVGCGVCDRCSEGLRGHCARRTVLGILGRDGAFAEYLILPAENLHPIPEGLPDEEAIFVEPLAAAFEILEQVEVHETDTVAVLGDGKLGLLCAQVMAQTGAQVTLVGKHPAKLAILARRGIRALLLEHLQARDFDLVVEATGSGPGLETAAHLVRPRGTVVLKTTVAGRSNVDLSPLVVKEITVVGSRCGPFSQAIDALVDGDIDVSSLIDACFPLSHALAALDRAGRPGALKVLLDMRDRAELSR